MSILLIHTTQTMNLTGNYDHDVLFNRDDDFLQNFVLSKICHSNITNILLKFAKSSESYSSFFHGRNSGFVILARIAVGSA